MVKKVLLFLIMVLVGVSCSSKKESKLKTTEFTIVYTSNIGGRYNPCGCRVPTGGLARRVETLKNILKENPKTLIFDSGSLLFPQNVHSKGYTLIDRITARLTSGIIQEAGLHALNVSSFDLVDGPDSLRSYFKAGLPVLLSCNIISKETGKTLFQPDTVFVVDDMRIGVFGLCSVLNTEFNSFADSSLSVLDPFESGKKEVEKLKKDCDFIVGLFYMDPRDAMSFAKKTPGVNVIVQSHTGEQIPNDSASQVPVYNINNTIVTFCPDGGRVIGRLDFILADKSTDYKECKQLLAYKYARDRGEKSAMPKESIYSNYFIKFDSSIVADSLIQKRIEITDEEIRKYAKSKGLTLESEEFVKGTDFLKRLETGQQTPVKQNGAEK